ncbi:3-(cis-5,6-dihydroxycyclohexa-1,3-dien-1-yl)propanoate dehydrogenase [Rhodococcus opacus]|uniref:3-(cis-5,6-dihydroxycyclohexa-1, 3-dien-1-yl)propanoate dehydrogenase n=1 Tax=Rhodococcus opacus TaxID=37919 RepID=UPI00146C5AE0|nr:3-(cis-5,6-dihydroxycyclohexa-1,3-dien-1-yl)propanoate dehydrogenase [Rhodococcus opacus]MDJ0420207.1 3-(cis-5,6-dihydroxycyclohexa-1,3-dien-1-yl)propanoate dehydrogenase [Rhodococcus opacus]MDV7090126.1 3-(cis-5,6-dihydroxycyclohexa-1,3-dien-1-yl)propanoate dehydrogenase [Rhodococcus opacus]UNN04528.1 3-(cis-5,6-dihydroxycyclohexa-1,3-dien-1-yl)propanoate dehydrogenase [Rhodococcus opacus]WKN52664.1 3-(cis-5,6-dihydroxycyclohexa-1,3-dien-1-yl)propanoate dehydrogenase [Rhodococcus opacus]
MGFLDGKVALVTGGGSGIGRAVVELYVQQGAKVGILEISPEKVKDLRNALPADSVVVTEGDATSMADNERAVADVVDAFGPLTTLVCVVGVFDYFTEIPQLPKNKISEAFDQLFGVNVKSNLLSVKAALDELIENEGDIILTLSNAAFYPGGGGPLYVSSKFAVRGLVTELAYELAPKVRVNGVAPGGTITELRGIPALANEGQRLKDVPDIEGLIEGINPLGIVAQPEDHSWAYALLASRERTSAVTGTIINSDGGLGVRGMTRMAGLAQ